ncbi:hypothetical protein [Pseudomonas tremae]|uniref:hypothetical protein n=1 Tax=Pseudomonas tremae TaxID=200454 RepID=UPI000412197F|nr:hypothetical protein [Pseudomonas tremae]
MINLEKSKAVWLVPEHQVGAEFDISVHNLNKIYRRKYSDWGTTSPLYKVIRRIEKMGVSPFRGWSATAIHEILEVSFKRGRKINSISDLPHFPCTAANQASGFFRLVFIDLWIRKKILLPLNFTAATHQDDILDEMAAASGCSAMVRVRSVNLNSSLVYDGGMSEEDRRLRQTHWLRFLLCTTIYNPLDMTETDINILGACVGKENEWILRYYPKDLIHFLSDSDIQKQAAIRVYSEVRRNSLDAKKLAKPGRDKKLKKTQYEISADQSLNFLEGGDHGVWGLTKVIPDITKLRSGFWIATDHSDPNEADFSGGYAYLPDKVKNFAKLLNSAYEGFVRSKRYQQEKNARIPQALLLAYSSVYLYKFFMGRDGHLGEYPTSLNDFSCELFVAGDSHLVDGLVVYKKRRPDTLIGFMNAYATVNSWSADTLYMRIKFIDHFFDHVVDNQARYANADNVKNTITPACYPRVKKRYGTVKKPIPRQYFATFMSMLYSLEALAMHLNDMAAGDVGGVLAGKLVQPTIAELTTRPEWAGIWGFNSPKMAAIDLEALSYCPIFYHDQKPVRFEYIPRFYRPTEMCVERNIGGVVERALEPRIVMNDVRIAQLMCETGIRQNHLIWLDRDQYDCNVDESSRRSLVPLYVSTDKAHSAWSAITSRRVLELLHRQAAWYDKDLSSEYQEQLWYDGKKNSAFGQFRPLFRLSQGINSWNNYDAFNSFLLCLQYFIKIGLGDDALKDIIWLKKNGVVEYIGDHDPSSLGREPAKYYHSSITPHGLRAGFVSEAIKFLPPFLVGQYFTGQTEELVYYYAVHDEDDPDLSFEQVLSRILLNNQQKIADGLVPELTNTIVQMNMRLQQDIERNPISAIDKHRLFSLERAKNNKGEFARNGVDLIRLEEATALAFNSTHICPFGNNCSMEAIAIVGGPNYCAGCPFAIRGAAHLPAISAQKDKYKELMLGVLRMIQEMLSRKPEHRSSADLERLEQEHDHFASQALLLEALELQLVEIAQQGDGKDLIVQRRGEVVQQYARFGLPEEAQLLKRLVDAQTFPDQNSPELESQLALLRYELLMDGPDAREKLRITSQPGRSASHHLGSLIGSMVSSGAIDEFDVYRICADAEIQNKALAAPSPVMLGLLG